jgi:glyoxylase-like metal-dependent hydrolase (beta-lactamase superfamily II)
VDDGGWLGGSRWHGGSVGASIECLLAPNPGPMTLDGTNTWLLSAPGAGTGIVVDPGPDDEVHLRAVLAAADERGVRIGITLLTHGHPDHSDGARRFAELSGAPVHALDPAHRYGGEGLRAGRGEGLGAGLGAGVSAGLGEGDVIEVGDLRLEVMRTPGHTADSLSFLVPDLGAFLTGDTVLGRGTAVVAYPDGRLGPYLNSLERMRDRCTTDDLHLLLPGHGPVLERPVEVLQGYLAHRRARLDQVRSALAAGATSAQHIVAVVYQDVDRALWPAAELSVRAQLDYLESTR